LTDTQSRHAYRIGLAGLAVTSIGWGLNWPAMKFLLRELPPLFARGSGGLGAALLVAVIALVLRQDLRLPRAVRMRVVLAALVNVGAWMGFATVALQWLDVSQTALLVYTMPIWATLLAWPLTGRAPSLRAALGLLICLVGLWTLFGSALQAFDRTQVIGVGFALASAVLFAFGTVALRPVAEMAPLPLLAWQLGLGSLPMLLYGVAFEQPELQRVSSTGWLLMAYMTLVPMGLCYLTWFAALRRLPSATASIATLLTPVIGVVAAAQVLGESLGPREGAAIALTLGGVALALFGRGDDAAESTGHAAPVEPPAPPAPSRPRR
jgi:drug/metabolite transporter (DMT)-like permease